MNYLEQELLTFTAIRGKLLERYPEGGYVVIKKYDILGIWDSREVAIKKALGRYGLDSFLVKNIQETLLNA